MRTSIRIFENKDELAHFFANILADGINAIPEGEHFSIALSGGSTPEPVFSYLATHFRNSINWQKLLVFWSDERCVPPDSIESNYRMASESLLIHVPIPGSNIFRIKGEADPGREAIRYEEEVRQHVPAVNLIPRFDMIMLGLGEDGHTASIYPGNMNLFKSKMLFERAVHPHTGQKRITSTGKLINDAKTVIFIVTGKSKAKITANVIGKKEGWEKLPCAAVRPVNGNLFWLLDKEAASGISEIHPQDNG